MDETNFILKLMLRRNSAVFVQFSFSCVFEFGKYFLVELAEIEVERQ